MVHITLLQNCLCLLAFGISTMKAIAIVFGFLLVAGFFAYLELAKEQDDGAEVKAYIESRGKTRVPRSWRGEVGKGI